MRYLDDILVLGSHPQILEVRTLALDCLSQLRLQANNGGQWNRATQGIAWLGFVVYPNRLRVNRNGRKRLTRKLRGLKRHYRDGVIGEAAYQRRAQALLAHVQIADDAAWRARVLSFQDLDEELVGHAETPTV